jgi:hypothetical protein
LSSLDISSNNIGQVFGWTYLPANDGDDSQWTYTHSDGRKQDKKPSEAMGKPTGVIALADAISDMGAMTKFTFSGDKSWSQCATMETTMAEADFSGKALGVSGGMMVAAFLPKCQ